MELHNLQHYTELMMFPYSIIGTDEIEIKTGWRYDITNGFTFNETLEKLLIKILNTKIASNGSCCSDPNQITYMTFKLFYKLDPDETKQYNREDKIILMGSQEMNLYSPKQGCDGILHTVGIRLYSLSNQGSVTLNNPLK